MAKYNVEWSISARGVATVEAESPEEAEERIGDIETDKLLDTADQVEWDTYPTFVSEG